MSDLRMLALVSYYSIQVYRLAVEPARAAPNKCLAQSNKSCMGCEATKKLGVVFRYRRRQMTKEEQVVGLIFQVTMWAYIAAAAAYVVIGWRHDCDLHALLEMSDHCAVIRFLPPITISCAI